ncbi:hypothetical protein VSX64_23800 [Aurantimonas sp. C2-6-R+9]|uniref:hypothetical protein n=1 Tax=unclassified Aurantimonas TaxID=2638230 RepID=UPI002E17249A|nr:MULTISPECIES: hypothetical protein [unclassified Aurantimonas]MEC5293670.1 hypothetical protein [Aurantimonas sp. C2-3-R2]MEC5383762.1 hypothetical protein [Aurantimonas sp. C2-6-R+9]MEC5414732.1 hypothetical protein [Aurantimonas sp. C2-4-R8]
MAPIEPVSPWSFELGTRYWYSTGQTSWNHTAGGSLLGDPTSILDYDDLESHSAELFGQIEHASGVFVKGYAGVGTVADGNFRDQDFFTGQLEFSDTYSEVDDGDLYYASADLGYFFVEGPSAENPRGPAFRLGAFVGYHYWNEEVPAYGARCNADDVGGLFCGAPGTTAVPFSTNVITNDAEWNSLRVGIMGEASITPRLHLSGEVAYIPYASLDNKDSHHLRTGLGSVPNIVMDGEGDGWMLESVLSYDVSDRFNVGVGGRYWRLDADGDIRFGPDFSPTLELNDFKSERFGVFLQASVKFP